MVRTRKEGLMKPPFVVSRKSLIFDDGRQMAFELLGAKYRRDAFAVTLDEAITATDTEMTVTALPQALKKGQIVDFGGGVTVTVSADTAAGATTVPILAAAAGVADNSVGYAGGEGNGHYVPAGVEVDLLPDGRVVPSSLGTGGGVTCYGIMLTPADEDSRSDAMSGYGVIIQGSIYENLLPEASGSPKVLNSTHKSELIARGGGWTFHQYSDNT